MRRCKEKVEERKRAIIKASHVYETFIRGSSLGV